METRGIWPVAGLEVRQQGGRPRIFGSFPYNALAVLADRGTVRKESIEPGAFSFTLDDPDAEINLLFGHNFDKPLASRLGGSLVLKDTEDFLTFIATIPEGAERATHITDALVMLGSGLIKGISPGFRVPPASAVPDAERLVPEPGNKEGVMIRMLKSLVLYELSLVTRPAYEASMAELRAKPMTVQKPPFKRWLMP